jgi:hypothetical protein
VLITFNWRGKLKKWKQNASRQFGTIEGEGGSFERAKGRRHYSTRMGKMKKKQEEWITLRIFFSLSLLLFIGKTTTGARVRLDLLG